MRQQTSELPGNKYPIPAPQLPTLSVPAYTAETISQPRELPTGPAPIPEPVHLNKSNPWLSNIQQDSAQTGSPKHKALRKGFTAAELAHQATPGRLLPPPSLTAQEEEQDRERSQQAEDRETQWQISFYTKHFLTQ